MTHPPLAREVLGLLILDESESDAERLRHALQKSRRDWQVESVGDLAAARAALAAFEPDVIVADLQSSDGEDWSHLVELRRTRANCAIVAWTDLGDDELAAAAIKSGADDYVSKSSSDRELRRAIDRAIRSARARAELDEKRETVRLRNAELASANAELATANAELAAVVEELERAREDHASLISMVVHDMRGPLGVLVNVAFQLTMQPDNARLATVSERATKRLRVLVNSLADLMLAETDHFRVRKVAGVDLGTLAEDAVLRARELFPDTTVEARLPAGLTHTVDPDQFIRVFDNLLNNAGRHAQTTILLEGRREGNAHILVVADDGPGVSPNLADTLFQRYERGNSSRGMGLGLAIVKLVVESHGGNVRLDNHPLGGAAFVVELPLRASDDESAED